VSIGVPKGRKIEIQVHVEKQGESLNGFINRVINDTIERDNNHET
jgi:hypothetical protein